MCDTPVMCGRGGVCANSAEARSIGNNPKAFRIDISRTPSQSETAVPIRMLPYVAIVGQVLQKRPPHLQSVHASLGFVEYLPIHANQNGVRHTTFPIGPERFDRIRGIRSAEEKVGVDGMLLLQEFDDKWFLIRVVDTHGHDL